MLPDMDRTCFRTSPDITGHPGQPDTHGSSPPRTQFYQTYAVSLAATKKKSRVARIELVTATTRTGRTSNTGLPRSQSRSPLRARAVASSVQRSPRARNSCRRAFLLRELRMRSLSFSFGWYRDVMQLGASTPSPRCLTCRGPRHGLTVVYLQEFGWYRDVMQLGASTPSPRCLTCRGPRDKQERMAEIGRPLVRLCTSPLAGVLLASAVSAAASCA